MSLWWNWKQIVNGLQISLFGLERRHKQIRDGFDKRTVKTKVSKKIQSIIFCLFQIHKYWTAVYLHDWQMRKMTKRRSLLNSIIPDYIECSSEGELCRDVSGFICIQFHRSLVLVGKSILFLFEHLGKQFVSIRFRHLLLFFHIWKKINHIMSIHVKYNIMRWCF